MKPAYWIGILALLGAIIGYALNRFTGWYGAASGAVIGIVAGVIIYSAKTKKSNQPPNGS